jgi:hypothetical protein
MQIQKYLLMQVQIFIWFWFFFFLCHPLILDLLKIEFYNLF